MTMDDAIPLPITSSPWRGKVYHVPNGAWRYFRDWETLAAYREFVIAADKSGI